MLQIRPPRLLEAKDSRARLVEHGHERDVEVRCVGAEREVHGGERRAVAAVYDEGARGGGPEGAVGEGGGFVDIGACGVLMVVFGVN